MENTSWIYLLTNYKFLYFINDLKKIFFDKPALFRFPYKYVTVPPIVLFKKKCYLTKPSIDYLINKHGMSGITNRDEVVKFLFLFTLSSNENIFIPQKSDRFFNITIKWYRFFTQHFYFKNKKYDCFDLFVFLLIFLQDFYVKNDKLLENLIYEFESSFQNKDKIFYFVLILISLILQSYTKNYDDLIDNSVSVLLFSCIDKSAFAKAFNHDNFRNVISNYNNDFDKILNRFFFSSLLGPETFEKFHDLPQRLDTSIIMNFHNLILNKENIRLHADNIVLPKTKILFDILVYIMILIVLSHKYSDNDTYKPTDTCTDSINPESNVYNGIGDSVVEKDGISTNWRNSKTNWTFHDTTDKAIKFTIKDIFRWLPEYIENEYYYRIPNKLKNHLKHLISNAYNIISQNYSLYFISHKRSNILFYEPFSKRIYFMIPSYQLDNMNLNLNVIRKYSKNFVEFIDRFVGKIS